MKATNIVISMLACLAVTLANIDVQQEVSMTTILELNIN